MHAGARQRESAHAIRGQPEHLERDAAAHRMAEQVERFGRLRERDARHVLERVSETVTIDSARFRESRELRRINARVADQSGQEQQHRSRSYCSQV
jgi:hypothetical protein